MSPLPPPPPPPPPPPSAASARDGVADAAALAPSPKSPDAYARWADTLGRRLDQLGWERYDVVGLGRANFLAHEIIVGKKARAFGATDIQKHMAETIHARCVAAAAAAGCPVSDP